MNNQSSQKSALGMEGNVTALLGYIIGIIAIVSVIIEKENRFVRFHAFQSLFWILAYIVSMIALAIVGTILTTVVYSISSTLGGLIGMLLGLLYLGLVVVFLGGLIFAAVKSFQGQMFKLPIIGNFAERYA